MPLFNSNFLTRLEYLSLVSRKVFPGCLMAQRRSLQLGSGIEFADHRQYAPGDDFRYLDWNLYARHDELLLKRFHEEEDLHVYLLLDCSRSMSVGNPAKFDLARQVTAALAYVALADMDRVSIQAFGGGVTNTFPLTRGKGCILSLMRFLEQLSCSGEATNLEDLTRQFVRRAPRRGLVILISDLFDPAGFVTGLDVLRHHRFEPWVIQLHDPAEANPTMLGDVELQDMESGTIRKLTVTEDNLRRYRERFQQYLTSVRDYCSKYGIGCSITDTSVSFDRLVLNMMRSTGINC